MTSCLNNIFFVVCIIFVFEQHYLIFEQYDFMFEKKETFVWPVGDPCRGKNPGQNVYFIDFSVKLCKIM